MKMPDFIVIGAPRCATTSLYYVLKKHSDIFMSPLKEPLFFAVEGNPPFLGPGDNQGIRNLEEYNALFSGIRGEKAAGEASPIYLSSEKAACRIKQLIPEVKLIVVLRDPVERAYSHFLLHRLLGFEDLTDFRAAMDAEAQREKAGWSGYWQYKKLGLYGMQLSYYLSLFKAEQIKIFLYDDLLCDSGKFMDNIYDFLRVDKRFGARSLPKESVSGYPKNRKFHHFLVQPNFISKVLSSFLTEKFRKNLRIKVWDVMVKRARQLNLQKPDLQSEVRTLLLEYYRDDILKTQDILKRNLSGWLKT